MSHTHTYIYMYCCIYFLRDKLGPPFRAHKLRKNPSYDSPFPCAEFGEAEGWAQGWLQSPQ